jgi:hypothetical protein
VAADIPDNVPRPFRAARRGTADRGEAPGRVGRSLSTSVGRPAPRSVVRASEMCTGADSESALDALFCDPRDDVTRVGGGWRPSLALSILPLTRAGQARACGRRVRARWSTDAVWQPSRVATDKARMAYRTKPHRPTVRPRVGHLRRRGGLHVPETPTSVASLDSASQGPPEATTLATSTDCASSDRQLRVQRAYRLLEHLPLPLYSPTADSMRSGQRG